MAVWLAQEAAEGGIAECRRRYELRCQLAAWRAECFAALAEPGRWRCQETSNSAAAARSHRRAFDATSRARDLVAAVAPDRSKVVVAGHNRWMADAVGLLDTAWGLVDSQAPGWDRWRQGEQRPTEGSRQRPVRGRRPMADAAVLLDRASVRGDRDTASWDQHAITLGPRLAHQAAGLGKSTVCRPN